MKNTENEFYVTYVSKPSPDGKCCGCAFDFDDVCHGLKFPCEASKRLDGLHVIFVEKEL